MKQYWPGLVMTFITSIVAIAICRWLNQQGWLGISPLMLGLIIGLVIANSPLHRYLDKTHIGLQFAQNKLLRLGVMLFGLHITVQQLIAVGWPGIGLAAVMVTSVLVVGYFVGTRILKLPSELALLTASGSAICGAAAVMAVDPVIKPKEEYTVVAVATVVIFGTIAMFGYPLLFPLLHMSTSAYAALVGSTVHEVAQVVVIGESISPQAANIAVIVKLARVMLLAPVLLILSYLWQRRLARQATQTQRGKITIPWFAFGFIAVVLLNGYLPLNHGLREGLLQFDTLVLAMAMSALGFHTRLANIRASSAKALLLALGLFMMMITISSTLIHFFWPAA
ncbi:YeiH family protein [Celerinatantimonas sp. YJH-8]|uniref:YeiH family protein n=1 Tax=Celerinatantimonas sp. YJH-8 TaxID=3228714 RepID=UPI0038C2042F